MFFGDAVSDSNFLSDEDDELAEAVLRVQEQHFETSSKNRGPVEEPSRDDATTPSGDEEVPSIQNVSETKNEATSDTSKIRLPSVSEAFASVSAQFFVKKPEPATASPTTTLDRVVASSSSTKVEPAVSAMTGVGLPDEGFWHVPLTFVDVS